MLSYMVLGIKPGASATLGEHSVYRAVYFLFVCLLETGSLSLSSLGWPGTFFID